MDIRNEPDRTLATFETIPAPPQKIDVYFFQYNMVAPADPIFAFLYNPTILTLPNTGGSTPTSYTVVFNLISNIPGTTLSSENTISGAPVDLQSSGDGTTQITLTFDNSGLKETDTLNYTLTVLANGTSYTSDDPEIIIPPPT